MSTDTTPAKPRAYTREEMHRTLRVYGMLPEEIARFDRTVRDGYAEPRRPLTWRDVFDCKVAGEHIADTAQVANDTFHYYMAHNDRIYRIQNGRPNAPAMWTNTGYTVEDLEAGRIIVVGFDLKLETAEEGAA